MRKRICLVADLLLFAPLWVLAQPSPYSAAGTLAAMRGKFRPLVIFYPQYPGERPLGLLVNRQRDLFIGHEAELKDRQVEIMYVPLAHDFESITPGMWTGLRKQFHVNDRTFTVILLGKDGAEKFRSHVPVTIEKLDALIDAMPMRQQEVRDGHSPK